MGITKNHIYTQRQIELARLFKALGHPARIAITDNLLMHENLNCNDLRSHIPLAQSTISAHLKVLFEVGALAVCVVGSNAYYEINKVALEPITKYLFQVFEHINCMMKCSKSPLYFRPLPHISPHHFSNHT
jgi:DNA-binding transcriptional ArsR family regulator